MPSALTHLGILDSVKSGLPPAAAKIIDENPNYAAWGSVGPDFLYFYPPDWNVIGKLGNFVFELQDATEDVVDLYDTVNSAWSRVQDYVTGGLLSQIQELASGVEITLKAFLANVVQQQVDFFEIVRPPLHADYLQNQRATWWWLDLTHHHKTMDFARELWRLSKGNAAAQAYSLGYLTHVGGDLVGHAYVNFIVGGPYRNHWRRHVFVEKCLDTHLWRLWTGGSLSNSRAYRRIFFQRSGYNDPQLPDELAKIISEALNGVYASDNIASGVPTAEDVQHMYRAFFRWFKGTTDIGFLNLPPPPQFDWYDLPDEIQRVLREIQDSRPSLGGPPLSGGQSAVRWKAFFRSLFKFCIWAIESIIKIATLPQHLITRLATTPLRYLVWLQLKLVYELYDKFRLSLATAGYLHPEPHHVDLYFADVVRPNAQVLHSKLHPAERYHNSLQTYHLIHPADAGMPNETPRTCAVPGNIFPLEEPDVVMRGPSAGSWAHLAAMCPGLPDNLNSFCDTGFPSAKMASLAIIDQFLRRDGANLPNWNLDADRGFAWPCWSTTTPKPWTASDFAFMCS